MDIRKSADNQTITFIIGERFDFELSRAFRDAYRDNVTQGMTYRIDFRATRIMDSSALGMLLLLKEHAGTYGGEVVLCNISGMVKEILEIARFHLMFEVE